MKMTTEKKVINPSLEQFTFEFTKNECYKLRTGKCSLEMNVDLRRYSSVQDNEKEYCPHLYQLMMEGGRIVKDPQLARCGCGHFIINDGRHRLCIAQQKNMNILVEISAGLKTCLNCH